MELLLPADMAGFNALAELALDMRWSWNHATDQLWRELDPVLWEPTHNPWGILPTVSREKLQRVLSDPAFRVVAGFIGETGFVRIAETQRSYP